LSDNPDNFRQLVSALKGMETASRTGTTGGPGFAQSGSPPENHRFSNDWKKFSAFFQ
jgi:hypothetical protein